jgi:hypothetical protein
MTGMVQVFIYTDEPSERPYWDEQPMSPSGDWYRYSMAHAHQIPREQLERWQATRKAMDDVEGEMAELMKTKSQ